MRAQCFVRQFHKGWKLTITLWAYLRYMLRRFFFFMNYGTAIPLQRYIIYRSEMQAVWMLVAMCIRFFMFFFRCYALLCFHSRHVQAHIHRFIIYSLGRFVCMRFYDLENFNKITRINHQFLWKVCFLYIYV